MTGSAMIGKAPSLAMAIDYHAATWASPAAPVGKVWHPASALYADGISIGNGVPVQQWQ